MKKMYVTTGCAAALLLFGGVATNVLADNHGIHHGIMNIEYGRHMTTLLRALR